MAQPPTSGWSLVIPGGWGMAHPPTPGWSVAFPGGRSGWPPSANSRLERGDPRGVGDESALEAAVAAPSDHRTTVGCVYERH